MAPPGLPPDPGPLARFADWSRQFAAAAPERRAARIAEGVALASQRRPLFKDLIRSDPKAALEQAVPMAVRQQLPPAVLALLEERVNHIGVLRVMHADPLPGAPQPSGSLTFHEAELQNGKTFRAHVYGRRAEQVTWTPGASLNGVALDSDFAISDEPSRTLEAGEVPDPAKSVVAACPVCGRPPGGPVPKPGAALAGKTAAVETATETVFFCEAPHIAAYNETLLQGEGVSGGAFGFTGILPAAPTPALGIVKVLAIPMTYADQNAVPSTEAALYATLRDVADFYAKSSYGRLTLVGAVSPPVKLSHNEAWYVNRDTSNGGDISGTGVEHAEARDLARKMGFDSNDYDCIVVRHNGGPGSYGGLGGGSSVWARSDGASLWAHEIGHCFGLGHSNFWDTAGTSSIGAGTNQEYGDQFDNMGSSGSYPAGHYNTQAKSQIKWLPPNFVETVAHSGQYRIHAFDQSALLPSRRYAMTIVKDAQKTYWGEVRSLFDSNPWAKSGLFLGWRYPNGGGGNLQRIDTTPGSPFAKDDAPVSLGCTFSDTESGIHLTTVAVNDSPRSVDVVVNFGEFPGNRKPTVALEASATVVPAGATVAFTATASDPDGDALAYSWQHFGDTGVKLVSGNLPVITRTFNTAGTYVVTCTVSDMKGGSTTRNQLITVGNGNSRHTIRGRVTFLGQGLQDVVVTANGANGVVTDADGWYTIPNLTANTYTMTPLLYGYGFGELFNNSVAVGPSATGADFEAAATPLVTLAASAPAAGESGPVNGRFTLTRTGDLSQPLVVNVNPAQGSAAKGTDYSLTPDYAAGSQGFSTFTLPSDAASLDVVVTPVNDATPEGPETATLQLGPGNGYLVGSASSATVVIDDDDTSLPKVSVVATIASATEGAGSPARITFSRTGATTGSLTVGYTVSGTAAAGADFTPLSGSAVIPEGSTSAMVSIAPVDDSVSESLENLKVTTVANPAYLIDPLAASATVNLIDDDVQTVSVAASDSTAREVDLTQGGAVADTGTFLITRSGDTTNPLTVYYSVTGTYGSGVAALHGVDYEALPGSIVIPAGSTQASVTILPRFDTLGEGPESVVFTLGAGPTNYIVDASNSATVTIGDAAGETPYLDVVNTASGAEASTNPAFRFSLRGDTASHTPLQVNFSLGGTAVNGTDYGASGWWIAESSGTTENLRAIWVADAANLWAVGDAGTILKGNGTSWTPQASGTSQHLRAVWGTGTSSVWAVGDAGVILFFNGTAWTPQTSGTTNALRSVWGSSSTNLFAVGDSGTILRSTNGTSWSAQSSGTSNNLRSVHGSGAGNVWAVGEAGVVRFWNGSVWGGQNSLVTTPLHSVFAANATNIWAVGAGGVVRKGSGTNWSGQTSASSADLNAVWAASATSLLVSGSSSAQMVSSNGSSWSNAMLNVPATFNGVAGASSTLAWAVGDGGAIFKRDAETTVAVPGSVVLPRAAATLDLSFRAIDDADSEDLESIELTLAPSVSYQTFAPTTAATAWLRDGDNVNTLVVDTQVGTGGAISIQEGASTSPVKFYVSRLGSATSAVTVNITYGGSASGGGVDYTAPASVTIPAGALGVDVPVTIVNDTAFEGTETILFEFAPGAYSRGPGAVMYLTDNDAGSATVSFQAPSSTGSESVTTVSVPVTLSPAQTTPVTVEYQTSGLTSSTNNTFSTRPAPYWVRLVKTGNSVAYFQSNDGASWTQRGSTATIPALGSTSYLAGLAFAPGSTSQYVAVLDNFTVSDLSPGGSASAETALSIGTVTGTSSVNAGVYTFANSGNGLLTGSTGDNFRFVHVTVTNSANCTVTARVVSNNNVNVNSRAGVMLRSSSAANSVHASALATSLTSGDCFALQRTASGASSTSTSYTSLILPLWVRTVRAGNVFTQSSSRDGFNWVTMNGLPNIALPPKVLAGLAVSAASEGQIATAIFDQVTLDGNPVTALGGRTIGFVNEQGSESFAGGVWTVTGSGSGVGGGNDEAHFPSLEVTGDFTLAARVTSLTGGANGAQAGIMVRENRSHYARAAYTGWVKSGSLEQRYRQQSVTNALGSGVDFALPPGVLTFHPGETAKSITLTVVNDTMDEPDNLITIQLNNPNGAGLGTFSYHGYTILDDDDPPPQPYVGFAAPGGSIAENAGTTQIAVALSAPATAACSVNYLTAGGSANAPGDYVETAGTLHFEAGETVKALSVPIIGDAALESPETFTITLHTPAGLILSSASTHTVTIADDDSPVVTIVANDPGASEAGDTGQFTISRTGDTTNPLTATVSATGTAASGTDYAGLPTTQIIPAGASSATLDVSPMQDAANEGNETVILTVASGSGYVPGTPGSATVTIADDDRSTVTIAATDPAASESPGNPGQFTISRTAPTTASLNVSLNVTGTATNATDYATIGSSVTIPAGQASVTVAVTPVDDGATEGAEDVTVSINAGLYTIGTEGFASVSIADNDNAPTLFISRPTAQGPLVAYGNGVIVQATVADDGAPNPVTLAWSAVSGPGTATIESPASETTAVTFDAPGTYVLRATATDGQFTVSDQATVVVGSSITAADWITQDLGPSSARRGQGVTYGGQFSVSGTGAGYAATGSDQAHVMVRSVDGDTAIVTRLTDLQGTGTPLAGITIRDTMMRGARRAVLGYVPGSGLQFRTRTTASANDSVTSLGGVSLPVWLKLERNAATHEISAAYAPDASGSPGTWTPVGTAAVISMDARALVGLTATSNNASATATALFDHLTLTPAPAGPALLAEDYGATPAAPGSSSESGGTYTIAGSTSGYAYGWQFYGDLMITAKHASATSGAGSATSGIRISENLEGGAYAHVGRIPQGAYNGYYWRSVAGGGGGGVPSFTAGTRWIRIVRRGNSITAYHAADSAGIPGTWAQLGQPQTVIMTTPVFAGFWVDNASGVGLNTVTFINLSIVPLNRAPVVNLAAVVSGSPSPVALDGNVADDNYPAPVSLTTAWSQVAGPGPVTFGDAALVNTSATFAASGTYRLRLAANDGSAETFAEVTFTGTSGAFDAWRFTHFPGGLDDPDAGPLLDPDGDGLPNLFEYATGGDPLLASPNPLTAQVVPVGDESYLRVSIPRSAAASDVRFEVQATGQLENDTSWTGAGLVTEIDNPTLLQVRDSVPVSSAARRFMRVRVLH